MATDRGREGDVRHCLKRIERYALGVASMPRRLGIFWLCGSYCIFPQATVHYDALAEIAFLVV